ncbi:MAG TPA: right-handed parallel beta-helix repeat-containing protein [Chthonomonadales bacterium]|nr:right-handed parallel beta-helix repeat-containing protein [Chthonomonadales bacterium]
MRSLIAIVIFLFNLLPAWAAPETLFVAPNGRDTWSGRLPAPNGKEDGPLATLAAARDRLRQWKKQGRLQEGATVLVRGGTYRLTRTLIFRPEDSGAPGKPIIYTAYPGETPILSGGRRITGWRKSTDLLWTARVPKGWYFTRLFVNDQRRTRAREPDTDNWSQWWKVVAGGPPEPDAPEGMGSKQFRFPPNTLKNWPNAGDIEINCLPSFRYANFIAPLEKVDEVTSEATLKSMAYYNFRPGDPFRVENVLAALDRPGEWCVDTVSSTVYYWPLPGEDLTRAIVVAPALTELVRFQGDEAQGRFVHDITLRGFTFTHCDRHRWHERETRDEANLHILDSSVYLEGTEHCAIEDCRFVNVAGFGARFNLTARKNRFVRNEVVGAGCGGIQVGGYGPGTKDVNKGHLITHNHIHHCSTDFWHAGAIDIRQSGENRIAYNLIHHMPYTAITISGAHTAYFRQYRGKGPGFGRAKYNFRWEEIPDDNPLTAESVKPFLHGRNNIVEYNVVYEVLGRLPEDGGALYGFGQGLGNVFRNNLVYRAHCLAIYLDAEFDGVLVQDNVVFDSASPFGGSGAYPTLVGNVLLASGQATVEVRQLARQLTRMAEQAAGPHKDRPLPQNEEKHPRDVSKRVFRTDFSAMSENDLAEQGGWISFGPGSGVSVGLGHRSEGYDPGMVAIAGGIDTWAAIEHGLLLDPSKDILIEMDACLPAPLQEDSFFELYLNAGQVHANESFGIALVGGAEDGYVDAVGVRQDSAGPRVLCTERLMPGHWYRIRLIIPANSRKGHLYIYDLTTSEKQFRRLPFANGATEATLTRGENWSPAWTELDTLVLRLGGGAQVGNIALLNPPSPTKGAETYTHP